MPVSVAVSNPPPLRVLDLNLDDLVLPTVGAGAPNLVDRSSSRTVAFTQTAGGPGRAFAPFIAKNYVGYSGGIGGYAVPLSLSFTQAANNASPKYPVHIMGWQFLCNTVTLPPAATDQGFFFKACTGPGYGTVYLNSVAFGVIPADERAFGINRNTTGGYDFVSIIGGVGRVTTPLVWPNNDPRFPVDCEYRFFDATAGNPVARMELYLNGALTLRGNMQAGDPLGLPFNYNPGKQCWLPCWCANDAARQVGATAWYYRNGPTLADVLNVQ